MTELEEHERAIRTRSWAAYTWLLSEPEQSIRATPVIELVEVLLAVLRDDVNIPSKKAYEALRRAVRLLEAFIADNDRSNRRPPWR